jgi:hypothetical protein
MPAVVGLASQFSFLVSGILAACAGMTLYRGAVSYCRRPTRGGAGMMDTPFLYSFFLFKKYKFIASDASARF